MPKFIDIAGKQFNRLTPLSYEVINGHTIWKCKCSCGNYTDVDSYELRNGRQKSCGCWRQEAPKLRTTHGMRHTRVYTVWAQMKQRCTNQQSVSFKNYGGRGIRMCKEWLNSFQNFIDDMGQPPTPEHSIDRIDNSGNYCPENCRWATNLEQANNTRHNVFLKHKGKRMTFAQWGRKTGISPLLIQDRIVRGWSVHDALETPARAIKMTRLYKSTK